MNKSKHTGTKISEYPTSLSNKRHKLLYNHYFMSYAPVNFGISTVNKNYKIPIQAIRDDIKYYIGLENAKGDWQNMIHFWSGDWFNEDKTESYVTPWTHEERGSVDYIKNKYGLEDDEDKIDRIFFIKDAPIPLEEDHKDPNPLTNKFVNKKYIDDRFNGVRKVSVRQESENGELYIRPYSCVYEYEETPTIINITDSKELQDGRKVSYFLQNNILTFIVKFPVPENDELIILANGEPNIKWSYPTEFGDILFAARKNEKSEVWLECFVGYVKGKLCVRCSNALNPMPGSEKQLATIAPVTQGVHDKVPTSDAVYNFTIQKTLPKIDSIEEGDFISVDTTESDGNYINPSPKSVKISVNTSDEITDDDTTVPTTQAVYNYINSHGTHEKWHEDNNYRHIDIFTVDALAVQNANVFVGADTTYGFVLKLPRFSQLESFRVYGTYQCRNYGNGIYQPTGNGNTDFNIYAKVIDSHTEKVIAVSYLATQLDESSSGYISGNAQFNFIKTTDTDKDTDNQPILLSGEEYKVIFSDNNDITDTKPSKKFRIAYADQNIQLYVEHGNPTTTYWAGEVAPYYLNSNGDKIAPPKSFMLNSQNKTCVGMAVYPKFTYTKKDFDILSTHITDIYERIADSNDTKLGEVIPGDFIGVENKNEVFVKTNTKIENDATTVPTTKAVHDSIEELIVSDQYNDFVFDLSNIFYEQIQKENPYIEKVLILSGDEIEIPYKEKYYSNVGTLKITGISKENYENIIFTEEGQLKDVLSDVAKDVITEKLILIAKNQSQEELESYIAKLEADVPYKATWVKNAKNNNIPTQLAFRHSSYRTNEILRMFFYYLDQEHGKEWGKDDSYSKKYMVPGLTYKCLTRPDTTFPTEQYYSYVYNIWLGDRGNTDRTLIAWNYEPSYLTIGSYPNESHGANWDGDSFTMPINWDTLVNEQAWDSLLNDYDTFKGKTEPHIADKEIHLTPDEKSMLLKDRFVIMEKSNISGTQTSETIAGIAIEPASTFTADRIVMGGITDLPSCVLYIWKNTDTGVKTVLQTPNANKSTFEWNLGQVVTFEENNTYFITWHTQQNSNAWAPTATAEQGYVKTTKKYDAQTGEHIFVLKVAEVGYNQPKYFGIDQIDKNYTIDCTFYLKNGKEPIASSPESVELISEDVEEIKKDIDEINSQITNFDTSLETIKSNRESSDSFIKSIIRNEDFLFNNYNPEIHTLGNHQGYMLVFTKKHFYTGKLLNIIIPHDAGGIGVQGGYLAIQVYKELNNENEIPVTYYSENQCNYIASSGGYRFNFENCVLDDYAKVHLTIVKDKTVIPPYKPTTETDYTKISKIRFQVIQKNGAEGEGNILGENDSCGVYWDTTGNLVDKLPHVAVNKLAVKLVDTYSFDEVEEESIIDVVPSYDFSFGSLIKSNNTTHSKACGIIINPAYSGTFNQITILSSKDDQVGDQKNVVLRIYEKQDDDTMVKIATSINPDECNYTSSSFTNVIYKFDNFNMIKGKSYYCEFVLIDENGDATSRAKIKVGLIISTVGSGTLHSETLNNWGLQWLNQYTATYKVEFVGDYPITAETTNHIINKFVVTKDGSTTNNIILFPENVTSTIVKDCEYYIDDNSITISVPKTTGTNYVIFKQMYIDKDNNKSGELIKHYSITI